jgi:drug/metabolite transporter (DMT)-like permease
MLDRVGPALCLASAVFFGAMPIFGRFAYEAGVSPGALLLVRFSLAAALLAILLLARPGLRRIEDPLVPPGRSRLSRRGTAVVAFGLGAVGYAAQAGLYFSALQRLDASLLSLILYTYPVLVTVAAVLLGRERLNRWRSLALLAACGGILLVLLGTGSMHLQPVGALLAFGSAVVYTSYILVSDTVVHRLAPVALAALVMTGAATTLGIQAILTGVDLAFGWRGWFWLACIAVVSTVLAMLSFFAGLRRTGASTAAILSTLEPVVTTALAALTLGESLTVVQVFGGILVLSSAGILQIRPRSRAMPPGGPNSTVGQRLHHADLLPASARTIEIPVPHQREPGIRL